jgi:hypothetical protein
MRFKDFMETGTSTADIAGFSRIALPLVKRVWPTEVEDMYPDGKKRKKHRVPQLDEQSRWRTDAGLRSALRRQASDDGRYGQYDPTPRAAALQKVKAHLGDTPELPGLTKWLDKLSYRANPDDDTYRTLMAGDQPKHQYRGASTLDGIRTSTSQYATRPDPIIHGSPYVGTATDYTSDSPEGKGVYATRLPGAAVIGRFKGRADQRYANDPELEQGVKGRTPDELLRAGHTSPIGGGGETNLAGNTFDRYMLNRDRGVDRRGRRRPQLASLSPDQVKNVIKPNLKMI